MIEMNIFYIIIFSLSVTCILLLITIKNTVVKNAKNKESIRTAITSLTGGVIGFLGGCIWGVIDEPLPAAANGSEDIVWLTIITWMLYGFGGLIAGAILGLFIPKK